MAAKEEELLTFGMKRATTWESYEKVRDNFADFDAKVYELLQFARPIDKDLQDSICRIVDEAKLLDLMGKIRINLKIAETKSKFQSTSSAFFDSIFQLSFFAVFSRGRKLFAEEMVSLHDILVALNRVISLTKQLQTIYFTKWRSDDEIFKPSNLNHEKIITHIEIAISDIEQSSQLPPEQRKELIGYLTAAKREFAGDSPSWNKIVGAFVIAATVISGIADAPQAVDNINTAIKYILGTSVERHIPRVLPLPNRLQALPDPDETIG